MSKKCDLIGTIPMSGNNVSHSNRKTKRKFVPNLNQLSLKSDALSCDLNLKITSATLRTVNKYGNIDNFLVNYRFSRLTDSAKKLRRKIIKSLEKSGKIDEIKLKSRKFIKSK